MQNINIRNKKAGFNFTLIEKYIAGIKLTGTEIKSIRLGKANMGDAYCIFYNNELFIRGLSISEYSFACGHLCMCQKCSEGIKECPLCRHSGNLRRILI